MTSYQTGGGLPQLRNVPETDVKLVLATHWHDDHIRGMSTIVEACNSAKFCCSDALGAAEFLAMVNIFKSRPMIKAGPGVREIDAILSILESRDQIIARAGPNRPVFKLAPENSGHGFRCSVTTLSPSDLQYNLFLKEIASLIPGTETKRRAIPQSPNHLTVATWVEIGDVAFLLGGDLEEIGNPKGGWQVIVTCPERPAGKALVFKVPHHGSANGHLADVWADMIVESPFALLTPWNRASKLPTQSDINRIVGLAEQSYATAHSTARRKKMRNPAVEKTLAEMNIKMREVETATGAVRLRNGGAAKPNDWSVSLRNTAYKLSAA